MRGVGAASLALPLRWHGALGALQWSAVRLVAAFREDEKTAMSPQSEEFSLRHARLLTLFVLIVVATAIALANLSSEPVTAEFVGEIIFKGKPAERAFGWPFSWYRRIRSENPGTRWPVTSRWPVSQYSATHLIANTALWIAMLAAATAVCWRLRRHLPRVPCRLRITTILTLAFVSALTVLANLSFDVSWGRSIGEYANYGWPLIWYWRVEIFIPLGPGVHLQESDYSAAALAGNLALWLGMMGLTALACERLRRRYSPRLRFSLRTLLAAVTVLAMLCAWYGAASDRADRQDAFVEMLYRLEGYDEDSPISNYWGGLEHDGVYVERRSPKWLGAIGAERLCRHIVGVQMLTLYSNQGAEENQELFKRLAQLPGLRFLDLEPHTSPAYESTSDIAGMLGEMRQLQMLSFACQSDFRDEALPVVREYLTAIGKLKQLERLRLSIRMDRGGDLASLSELTNLKTLSLDIQPFTYQGGKDDEHPMSDRDPRLLGSLPALPRLEDLDLDNTRVGDDDLDLVVRLMRLRTLDLSSTSVTDAGLEKLAPLESLEELVIDQAPATAAGFEALARLRRLRTVHIAYADYDATNSGLSLPLGDGGKLAVSRSDRDGIRRALEALRRSHPGIVIDGNYDIFHKPIDLEAPWGYNDPSMMRAFVERWLYER
jgi:hypothetical protein